MKAHRSVKTENLPFVGWSYLVKLVERARDLGGLQLAAFVAALFEGGWRISEVVESRHGTYAEVTGLKPENIRVYEGRGMLRFVDVVVEKKYSKLKGSGYVCHETGKHVDRFGRPKSGVWDESHRHFATERRKGEEVKRSCPVPLFEPLIPPILEYKDKVAEGDYLFPFDRFKAWRYIVKIDPEVWPHWFRSQRASQLGASPDLADRDLRGYGFSDRALTNWFSWTSLGTARVYAHQDTAELERLFPSSL